MGNFLIKKISTLLLGVLACSCTGLGLGMIGHELVDQSHDSGMHDCCAVSDRSEDGVPADVGTTDHHTLTQATLVAKDLLSQISLPASVSAPLTFVGFSLVLVFLYARLWRERWRYNAFLYTRLFSRGILHPKSW